MMTTHSTIKNHCLSCRIRNGIPTIHGHVWGYYASRNGARMLVVECGADQRIRINDAVEIVVIKTCNGNVQLGIDNVADLDRSIRARQRLAEAFRVNAKEEMLKC